MATLNKYIPQPQVMNYGPQGASNYANLGDNWASQPQQSQAPSPYSMESPMPVAVPNAINGMDFASDNYANAGIMSPGGNGLYTQGPNTLSGGGGQYGLNPTSSPTIPQIGAPGGFVDTNAGGSRSFMDSMLGGKNTDGTSFNGWGGAAITAASSMFNAYMGMKQYGLAKEQFAFNKDMTKRNFNAQASQTNLAIDDRDKARQASGQASNNSGYKVAMMG